MSIANAKMFVPAGKGSSSSTTSPFDTDGSNFKTLFGQSTNIHYKLPLCSIPTAWNIQIRKGQHCVRYRPQEINLTHTVASTLLLRMPGRSRRRIRVLVCDYEYKIAECIFSRRRIIWKVVTVSCSFLLGCFCCNAIHVRGGDKRQYLDSNPPKISLSWR